MPSHILVNSLGLTYKSTVGVSTATLPDVCKTPSPAGPVPIPYPNFANQSSLKEGTTTVKAKGKMIAIKGSEYSMSFGDEPGTIGGIKSSTFKKETAWITYSFDVKMDGKNACRHTDKKFHNHKNTVDLAGNIDPSLAPSEIRCAIHECDNASYNLSKIAPGDRCDVLGSKKHACLANKLKNKEPDIYSETFVSMIEKPPQILTSKGKGVRNFFHARNKIGKVTSYKPGQLRRPDMIFKATDGSQVVADAKFPCPDDVKSGKKVRGKMQSPSGSASMLTGKQRAAYKVIQNNGKDPMEIQPTDCSASDCS